MDILAHTLGSDETPSSFIPDPTRSSSSSNRRPPHMPGTFQSLDDDQEEEEEDEVELEVAIRHMFFFSDGFCIDDGDLLEYGVPANEELLEALTSGLVPLSFPFLSFLFFLLLSSNERITNLISN